MAGSYGGYSFNFIRNYRAFFPVVVSFYISIAVEESLICSPELATVSFKF